MAYILPENGKTLVSCLKGKTGFPLKELQIAGVCPDLYTIPVRKAGHMSLHKGIIKTHKNIFLFLASIIIKYLTSCMGKFFLFHSIHKFKQKLTLNFPTV